MSNINLPDFFYYYNPELTHHQLAIRQLGNSMPESLMQPNAKWVQTYRTPLPSTEYSQYSPIPGAAITLIKEFESFRGKAYPDPGTGGKPWTNGYGSTRKRNGEPWKPGEPISEVEAMNLLKWQLEKEYLPGLRIIENWKGMNDNQRSALISFAWNCGAHFYEHDDFSTITTVLRNQQYNQIRNALMLYVNPGTRVEEGLRRRRKAEADLFEKAIAPTESSRDNQVIRPISWHQPQAKISKNFRVWEVNQRDPRRIPENGSQIETNILALARELELIRHTYGSPIGITSWYRPPQVNAEVGGAGNSQHLHGRAADIYPIGKDIYAFEEWLNRHWADALGLGAKKGFVHIDIRNGNGMSMKTINPNDYPRWDY